jgi:hypothetical protein
VDGLTYSPPPERDPDDLETGLSGGYNGGTTGGTGRKKKPGGGGKVRIA